MEGRKRNIYLVPPTRWLPAVLRNPGQVQHCPSPLGEDPVEQRNACLGHKGALRLSQPFFSHLLLSPCLTWAILGVKNLNLGLPWWSSG